MSSILKAIRKVEEEKRAASYTAPDLRSDQGASVHVKKSLAPLITGMMLGAVCVGLFLYVTSDQQEEVVSSVVKPPEENVVVTNSPEPAPVKPAVETIPVVTLPPEPVAVESLAPPSRKPTTVAAKKIVHNQAPAKVTKPQKPAAVASQPKPLPLPDHIDLNVAEIFYQDDSTNSMAVVNDLPVMPGTAVDGALVQVIRPDHVVFRIDGKDYPVFPAK